MAEYRNGNAPRWMDLIIGGFVGGVLGALATFTIMTFAINGRLSAVETALNMHMKQHNGHDSP